jgi:hypothetical protein
VFSRLLLVALVFAGVLGITHPLQAATTTVTSNIAFANPLQVSSSPEIHLPVLIRINNFGSVWMDKSQMVASSDQRHDFVDFTGPEDQIMNFLTLAYSDGAMGKMVPIKSVCSIKSGQSTDGKGGESCDKLYGSLQNDKETLYTGMDTVFLTSLTPSASKNNKLSFFDLCAVYQ